MAGYPRIYHHLPKTTQDKRDVQTCTDSALPASCDLGDAQASQDPKGDRISVPSGVSLHLRPPGKDRGGRQQGSGPETTARKVGPNPQAHPKTGPGTQSTGWRVLNTGDGKGGLKEPHIRTRDPSLQPKQTKNLPSRTGCAKLSEEGATRPWLL